MLKKLLQQYVPRTYTFLQGLRFLVINLKTSSPFSKNFYVYYPTSQAVYFAIPKTGNSTINAMFLEKEGSYNEGEARKSYAHIHQQKDLYAVPKKSIPQYDCEKIAIVRNPYDRIISCYKNKVLQEDYFVDRNMGGLVYNNMPFYDFVKAVSSIPDAFLDDHLKSQKGILHLRKKPLYTKLFYFETFQKALDFLESKYQLKPKGKINTSTTGTTSPSAKWITEETAELIYNKYRGDFIAFGYQKESWREYT